MGRDSKAFLKPATITPQDIHEVHLRKEISITATKILLAVKTLKAGMRAGCNEIRSEILKTLNREGILWLTCLCQLALCSGRTTNVWETEVIITIHKHVDRSECTNYRGNP